MACWLYLHGVVLKAGIKTMAPLGLHQIPTQLWFQEASGINSEK